MKYINIIDLRDFECYNNINCRLLYLELCSLMDVRTRNVTISQRAMERNLPMTYAAIRHALGMLLKDGLVAQVTAQEGAQEGAQRGAQRATHLHIMSFSELNDANNATSSAESNAESNAERNAESSAYSNKGLDNYNYKKSKITLTRAKDLISDFEDSKVSLYVDISVGKVGTFKSEFLARMSVKNREWNDESDLISHFLDWCCKNKKSLLQRADQSEQHKNQEQKEQTADVPHPKSIPLADWLWICKMVKQGNCAPAVKEEYERGCAELASSKA